jgi:septal ring factor EnvC (AmiA/AmiB activator)
MSVDGSSLPKGLFGYRKTVVDQILEDRDIMVRAAEERVRSSESRVQELEAELDSVKAQSAGLEGQMDRFGERLDSLSARVDESTETPDVEPVVEETDEPPMVGVDAGPAEQSVTSKLVAQELTSILIAGQEAAARMIERARDEAQRQIVEANQLLGEVHTQVRRFASWRDDVQPAITRVQSFVDVVRSHIAQTPERVQQALAPLAEVMFSIDTELAELSGVCHSPFTDGERGDAVVIPETESREDRASADSIWLTVEEDQVAVAEGQEQPSPLEASAG